MPNYRWFKHAVVGVGTKMYHGGGDSADVSSSSRDRSSDVESNLKDKLKVFFSVYYLLHWLLGRAP